MSTVTVNATATTATACGCCGTLDAANLECRTRGGTAVLCGISEFTGASTPPKKYRQNDLTGQTYLCYYPNFPSCTGNVLTVDSYAFTTTSTPVVYNSGNCNLTLGTYKHYVQSSGTLNCAFAAIGSEITESWSTGSGGNAVENGSGFVITRTPTTRTTDYDGTTCLNGGSFPGLLFFGQEVQTLSVEDTNQDAINRLLAGAGGTWGSWLTPGSGGCTGIPPPCCLARWEERTSDFDFIYQEAEYRVTASGLTPSTAYGARVEIYRSVFGANSYSLFQTLIVNGTTDGSGNFSEDGAVPNEEGFESYAAAAYIIIPP